MINSTGFLGDHSACAAVANMPVETSATIAGIATFFSLKNTDIELLLDGLYLWILAILWFATLRALRICTLITVLDTSTTRTRTMEPSNNWYTIYQLSLYTTKEIGAKFFSKTPDRTDPTLSHGARIAPRRGIQVNSRLPNLNPRLTRPRIGQATEDQTLPAVFVLN